MEILRDYASREPQGRPKRIVLRFLLSPTEILADQSGRVGAVGLVQNELVADEEGRLRARATDRHETVEAGLVFRAIGYRGIPLPGVPFDDRGAVIPNHGGRVVDPSTGDPMPGEFAVGWIKRGPTGVIGTNKKDAQETVDAILADLAPLIEGPSGNGSAAGLHLPSNAVAEQVEGLFRSRQPDLITYRGWEAIDRHERALGEPAGRPRVKLTRIEQLLEVAAREQP